MMIKEIDRTANVAWSPTQVTPIYLTAGTAAQQLDATFSTTSALEIYELNVDEPGLDMLLKGSVSTEHRFHKVSWGAWQRDDVNGVIVGGCDGGHMFVYSPARLLDGNVDEAIIAHKDKHTGPVRALDFNVFQENLLASGASESEILIWDLNNLTTPMTPGVKSQPADDVTCIAWNCQVQHILASTFGTRCVVWDLRKNDPIIKVSGSTSRMRCKVVSWHPSVATQMCLASEDDHTPFIQLWDLRFATSPLKTFESHHRGILSLSWCFQDPDLLLSCGKDCRIICWNPNSNAVNGEVICEIPTSNQWSFDVAWSPRNPALLSSCSFDGHVSVYSVLGGTQHVAPSAKITEAFMDSNFQMQQAPNISQATSTFYLRKAPKWLQRPVGTSFGFGGKLVTFCNESLNQQAQGSATKSPVVFVSQVVTEPDLIDKASQLEVVLSSGQLSEFCAQKAEEANSTDQRQMWSFMRAHFDVDPKSQFLSLLGHATSTDYPIPQNVDSTTSASIDGAFDAFTLSDQLTISTGSNVTGTVSELLLTGQLEAAVETCMKENLLVEALLLSMAGGQELLVKTQNAYFKKKSNDSLSQLIAAVVTKNWREIVNSSNLNNWKEALCGAIVYSDLDEFTTLCETLGQRLEHEDNRLQDATLCYICSGSIAKLVECWSKHTVDVTSTCELQTIVEQVSVLKRTSSGSSRANTLVGCKQLSDVLFRYASNLASQGKLSLALSHLEPSEEEQTAILQNRLSQALNYQSSVVATNPRTQVQSNWSSTQQQQPPVPQQQARLQPIQPTLQSFLVRPQRNEVLPRVPKYPIAATMQQPAISPVQPYSRGSISHNYPHVDPVTQATYNQPPMQFPPPSTHSTYGGASVTTATTVHGQMPTYGGNVPASLPPPPPPLEQPHPVHAGHQTAYEPNPSPELYGPAYPEMRTGWNDPPLFQRQVQKQVQPDFQQPAPITHPLYGMAPETPLPPVGYGANVYDQSSYVHHQQQVCPSLPPDPQSYNVHGIQPVEPLVPQMPAVAVAPPQPVVKPKGPIPTEHAILHDLFEEIRTKCLEASTNQTTKRKLEDVARKLEVLYDKLRDNELSSNTTLGLHQIAQVIQQRDYLNALHIHTEMVSTGTFSEIGGFMPGLKVLLQTAQQLTIYV